MFDSCLPYRDVKWAEYAISGFLIWSVSNDIFFFVMDEEWNLWSPVNYQAGETKGPHSFTKRPFITSARKIKKF